MDKTETLTIGVLALQGAFQEHLNMLSKLPSINPLQVKTPKDLSLCDALILPGGESTAISLAAHRNNLILPLQQFIKEKPVWGTCAGLILLSNQAKSLKQGGQELLGGLNIKVNRNAFGHQVDSFTQILAVKGFESGFNGIFIRAPVIESVGDGVEVLASVEGGIVAVRQGKMLGTSFHPELTNDLRFHKLFVDICRSE